MEEELQSAKAARLPETICPACGNKLNAATDPANEMERPGPGDPSVCAYCSAALVFQEDMTLRRMEAEEFKALPSEVRASIWRMAGKPDAEGRQRQLTMELTMHECPSCGLIHTSREREPMTMVTLVAQNQFLRRIVEQKLDRLYELLARIPEPPKPRKSRGGGSQTGQKRRKPRNPRA